MISLSYFLSRIAGSNLILTSLNKSIIKDLNQTALYIHYFTEDIICIYNKDNNNNYSLSQNLFFFKLVINEKTKNLILNPFSEKINLKSILFPNDNNENISLDINYIKTLRKNCLFISTLQNKKEEKNPSTNFINSNVFLKFNLFLNKIKITYFNDTYYPNDDYSFKNRAVIEASETLYDK